jgi:hypothetical protein
MISVGVFINNERIELFDDEKISVTSSIQNINDISKVFTDYSQTFTVPASKKNNRIFLHWYENSLDSQFSTNVKADAYIELDTVLFRRGKVQLESCTIIDGQPQNYSITFIGSLASLKDKFAGLFLKDLDSTFYDFNYTANVVRDKVTATALSADVMFPLVSSDRYWSYGSGGQDVNVNSHPIRYNELFPALRVKAVFDMIARDSKWDINFNGDFLNDARFTNAYLWLKSGDLFNPLFTGYSFISSAVSYNLGRSISTFDVSTNTFNYVNPNPSAGFGQMLCSAYFTARVPNTLIGKKFWFEILLNGQRVSLTEEIVQNNTSFGLIYASALPNFSIFNPNSDSIPEGNYTYKFSLEVSASLTNVAFNYSSFNGSFGSYFLYENTNVTIPNYTYNGDLLVGSIMPQIKIEDFFSGILKMFNLTCFSEDGINFTVEQLETYYNSGAVRDITKYIKSDNINLNRVKTFKKINFEYEKSESIVNVGFLAANGVEYGSLLYSTSNEGEEYSIKLPFENLNFSNLKDKFQVGFALKSDLAKYVPKPVILYDFNPDALTALTDANYHFSTDLNGNGVNYTSYKAFGQEYSDFSLNFNSQQSTITNELISKSLYNQYYENYFANIFSFKARIYKAVAIFPISILTSLKLNDNLIIRDKKFIINSMTTDLTTGEVQLELLTDFRQ